MDRPAIGLGGCGQRSTTERTASNKTGELSSRCSAEAPLASVWSPIRHDALGVRLAHLLSQGVVQLLVTGTGWRVQGSVHGA